MYYSAPMIHEAEVVRDPGYVTDIITDHALRFLDSQVGNSEPFYLSVHYTAPHSPWGRDQHPDGVYDDYYEHCAFRSVPQEPRHPWQMNSAPYGHDDVTRRALLSGYFAAVTEMDRNLGRMLTWLDRQGLRENTLVFFTSDNGMNMGHHGIYGKGNGTFPQNMYEESVKVPALVSRPGHVPEGETCAAMLSHYDFMPTLLDYLGLENREAEQLPGRSFASLLRGQGLHGRESVVVYDEYGPVRMIRTTDWKYVHRYPYGPNELWDLAGDPGERENLIDDPHHQGKVVEMKAGLEEWFARYVDPLLDGRVEPVTGKGQLGLAGPAGCGERNFSDDWHYLPEDMKWQGSEGAPK
jgi:arylsulfatase A-like enzyme